MCPSFKEPPRVFLETRTEAELALLRALCEQPASHAIRAKLIDELADYRWQKADHQVVYKALSKIHSSDPEMLRQQLPAVATRMGFPDINWERYFASAGTSGGIDRIYELVRELKACTK